MATASLAVLALGFVVAVAAGPLPGDDGETPLFDLRWRSGLDLSPILAWILLAMAVVGAVLFAYGVREARPSQERRRRRMFGAVVALIVFVIVFRWVRPAAEALLEDGATLAESATDAIGEGQAGTAGGWLFSLLLAAVVAAALTRIGLSINSAGSPFQVDEPSGAEVSETTRHPGPVDRVLGEDPRSRILRAYQEFEVGLDAAGQPRSRTETTGRHAHRAGASLALDLDVVGGLVGHHSRARFGSSEPGEVDAETAEELSSRLRREIDQ